MGGREDRLSALYVKRAWPGSIWMKGYAETRVRTDVFKKREEQRGAGRERERTSGNDGNGEVYCERSRAVRENVGHASTTGRREGWIMATLVGRVHRRRQRL
jgi:hypothetical protein